jgi:hypothetical protein
MIARYLTACALTAVTGGLTLADCRGAPADGPRRPTSILVEVRPRGPGGPAEHWEITCPAQSRRPVCRRLQATPREAFAPVPREAVCTAIYGGPATARVEGRLRDRRVSARFDLHNGCAIARWRRFAWLLGKPPGRARGPRGGEGGMAASSR